MKVRAQSLEQRLARPILSGFLAYNKYVHIKAQCLSRRSCISAKAGGTLCNQCIGILYLGIRQKIIELSDLIPPKTKSSEVVSLYINIMSKMRGEALKALDSGRSKCQIRSGESLQDISN
jgi:hypothetical protein